LLFSLVPVLPQRYRILHRHFGGRPDDLSIELLADGDRLHGFRPPRNRCRAVEHHLAVSDDVAVEPEGQGRAGDGVIPGALGPDLAVGNPHPKSTPPFYAGEVRKGLD